MMNMNEDMDLDALVNNPFREFNQREKPVVAERIEIHDTPPVVQQEPGVVENESQNLMERNHPLELRVRSLEKNEYSERLKTEDIKRIIEHQNERIRLLEEELALLRKEMGGRKD